MSSLLSRQFSRGESTQRIRDKCLSSNSGNRLFAVGLRIRSGSLGPSIGNPGLAQAVRSGPGGEVDRRQALAGGIARWLRVAHYNYSRLLRTNSSLVYVVSKFASLH